MNKECITDSRQTVNEDSTAKHESPIRHAIEFGSRRRDELKAAVEINVRAYENYVYFTNYFPDRDERIKAIRDMNRCAQQTIFGKTNCLVARQDGRIVALVTLDPPGYQAPRTIHYLLHGWWLVCLRRNMRLINRWLAMDEEASRPCHDYQRSVPDVWYLSSLAVDPSVHGQGVGSRFIAYLEDYIRARGGKELILFTNSEENLVFYRRRGFEVFHEEQIVNNGKVMGCWSMKKIL